MRLRCRSRASMTYKVAEDDEHRTEGNLDADQTSKQAASQMTYNCLGAQGSEKHFEETPKQLCKIQHKDLGLVNEGWISKHAKVPALAFFVKHWDCLLRSAQVCLVLVPTKTSIHGAFCENGLKA